MKHISDLMEELVKDLKVKMIKYYTEHPDKIDQAPEFIKEEVESKSDMTGQKRIGE